MARLLSTSVRGWTFSDLKIRTATCKEIDSIQKSFRWKCRKDHLPASWNLLQSHSKRTQEIFKFPNVLPFCVWLTVKLSPFLTSPHFQPGSRSRWSQRLRCQALPVARPVCTDFWGAKRYRRGGSEFDPKTSSSHRIPCCPHLMTCEGADSLLTKRKSKDPKATSSKQHEPQKIVLTTGTPRKKAGKTQVKMSVYPQNKQTHALFNPTAQVLRFVERNPAMPASAAPTHPARPAPLRPSPAPGTSDASESPWGKNEGKSRWGAPKNQRKTIGKPWKNDEKDPQNGKKSFQAPRLKKSSSQPPRSTKSSMASTQASRLGFDEPSGTRVAPNGKRRKRKGFNGLSMS